MLRRMCRAKIHGATVTESRLDYEGSIQIDEALMEAAGLLENEMVLVANLANGERFETYVIKGKRNSGVIGLNGAAAHLGEPGHKLIVMSVAWIDDKEARHLNLKVVKVNDQNQLLVMSGK
ncbi:MAG: aspartate 1-decarboxylase [Elusimicrobia bacterium]|nr:aspartate 1-decarboxylase [Candidatus Obscuribacterium magneticum]